MSDNRRIFGTDGVRGIANVEPVTAETALKLGRAARACFYETESACASQRRAPEDCARQGYPALRLHARERAGRRHYFTGSGRAHHRDHCQPRSSLTSLVHSAPDAGIVLSASHNPYADNGIKFFRHDGYKLDDQIEQQIEQLVFSREIDSIRPTAGKIGRATRIDDALGRYVEVRQAKLSRAE
jgi:phosphoglucosamine mutase